MNASVIGLGWWGRKIVGDLRDSPHILVRLGVDPSPDGRAAAEALGVPTATGFDDALADDDVDAVILCTPHKFHADQIVAAALAGKHVFCEKPLATTGVEARKAIDAVTSTGVRLGVGHEKRFEPAVIAMREQVAAGALGAPLVFEGNFSQDKFLDLPPDNWRLSDVDAPVGPLSATGIHLVDLAIALFGRPVSVWARLATLATGFANGDTLAVTLAFPGGATALITAVLTTPFAGRVALYGSRGWMEIRDRNHPEDPRGWDVTTVLRGADPVTVFQPPHPSVRENIERFARAAAGELDYPVTLDEMLANVETFEAITRSARSGQVEPVG
jgi:predicted dehydrogenase